jgi:hypothetical protein
MPKVLVQQFYQDNGELFVELGGFGAWPGLTNHEASPGFADSEVRHNMITGSESP